MSEIRMRQICLVAHGHAAPDRARALANAEAAGCLTGDDLVTICGVRLRLV